MNNWQEILQMFGVAVGSIIAKELITFLKKYICTSKDEKLNKKLKKHEKGIEKCKKQMEDK